MNTIRLVTSGAVVAALTAFGIAATAAPASAATIKSNGTATRSESNKLHREIDRQTCLTLHESQKIVGAKGSIEQDEAESVVNFKGKKKTSVQSVSVYFYEGCAAIVVSDLTHGRWQYSINENNLPADDEEVG